MKYTDKQLLDFLEAKNKEAIYTGKCRWRLSSCGRGWRLYETSQTGAKESVRDAIGDAIDREKKGK